MIELGDLREGILPVLIDFCKHVFQLSNIDVKDRRQPRLSCGGAYGGPVHATGSLS